MSTGSPSVFGRKPECPLHGGSRPCPSRTDTTECSSNVDSSRRLLSSWRCRFGSSAVGRVARNPLNHLLMVGSRCWYFPQWDDRVCAENWIEASLVIADPSRHISMETSCSDIPRTPPSLPWTLLPRLGYVYRRSVSRDVH